MISPRHTRLVRVPDLHRFRQAVAALVAVPSGRTVVLVPTGGAARQLRRTLGRLSGGIPHDAAILTRDEWYDALGRGLGEAPRRLTAFERDSIAHAAALAAAQKTPGLSFQLRPGLVRSILSFYDTLKRQGQQVQRFEELIQQTLAPAADAGDRGAGRLAAQTAFLAETFRGYERRLADLGAYDEHILREALLAAENTPYRRTIITTADWIADPGGLFVADFDLVARIGGLEAVDLVATEGTLSSGFHQRVREWLPGLDEVDFAPEVDGPAPRPTLIVPAPPPDRPWHTERDRADELSACARRIRADRRAGRRIRLDRIAIVYRRPLPYLYLAAGALGSAGIPWSSADALPLAGEPTAAAIDLVLECVETAFTRDTLVALLRSPHFLLGSGGAAVSRVSIAALDRALSQARYLGDLDRLESLASAWRAPAAREALDAALGAARALAPLRDEAPASQQVARLQSFVSDRLRPLSKDDPFAAREARARAAIAELLERLIEAHGRHHDPFWTIQDLSASLRRWIGELTFPADEEGRGGVELLDDQAARYGLFDDIAIVGVNESEWPEATRRNIFYPLGLLRALGFPAERDRSAAEAARFVDLVASPSSRVAVSAFTLDDESLVARSVLLDDLHRVRLPTMPDVGRTGARIYPDEVLTASPPAFERLPADVRGWADLRRSRPPLGDLSFHGSTGPRPARPWSVSALETYLECPFRFFAQHILALEEEPEDEEIMDPRRQGRLLHDVFETFFREWQAEGRGNITPANLEEARALFTAVVDRRLAGIPDAEAGLERTRLLGSPAAAGLGEAVFRMEAERPVPVVERLIEHRLEGPFLAQTADGPRTVILRGKADRIDLLEDGTFRLIDYKLGWPPHRSRALQLPIYGLCAEQRLSNHLGRAWTLAEAAYLAFKGPKRVVPLFAPGDRERVLADAQVRLVSVVDAIERGDFPPAPDDVFRCETCSFTSVCRKDYVGDPA